MNKCKIRKKQQAFITSAMLNINPVSQMWIFWCTYWQIQQLACLTQWQSPTVPPSSPYWTLDVIIFKLLPIFNLTYSWNALINPRANCGRKWFHWHKNTHSQADRWCLDNGIQAMCVSSCVWTSQCVLHMMMCCNGSGFAGLLEQYVHMKGHTLRGIHTWTEKANVRLRVWELYLELTFYYIFTSFIYYYTYTHFRLARDQ